MRAPGRTFDALANGGVQICEKGSVPEGSQLVSPKSTVSKASEVDRKNTRANRNSHASLSLPSRLTRALQYRAVPAVHTAAAPPASDALEPMGVPADWRTHDLWN
jgi:hypothetical protein